MRQTKKEHIIIIIDRIEEADVATDQAEKCFIDKIPVCKEESVEKSYGKAGCWFSFIGVVLTCVAIIIEYFL